MVFPGNRFLQALSAVAIASGQILLYTGWLCWVFRGKVRGDIGYHQAESRRTAKSRHHPSSVLRLPIMLNFLLTHKIAIGQIFGAVAATATVVIFENVLAWDWYVAIPVAVLAYLSMPILLVAVLDSLATKSRQ